jgi:isocitrate dehydrogenase
MEEIGVQRNITLKKIQHKGGLILNNSELSKTVNFVNNALKFGFHNDRVTLCITEGSNVSGFVGCVFKCILFTSFYRLLYSQLKT